MATNAKTPDAKPPDAKIANNKTASAKTMTTNTVPYETTARVRDTCLCLAAQRAARALARRFDHAFRPLGLTSGQFSLLMSLNRPAPASMGSIAELLAMDRTTLTANTKTLAKRGLVSTSVDPADRRGRRLTLTAAGQELLASALPVWIATQKSAERKLVKAGSDV